MSSRGLGVVAGAELTEAVRRAGADHVEPTIAGNLVLRDGTEWTRNEVYAGARFPSFAILVPGDLPLLTTEFDTVRSFFESVLPIVRSVAEPDATIVFGSGTARRAPEGMGTDEALRRFAEVVRTARDVAAANDLRIVVEPLSRAETNVLNTVAETIAFLDAAELDGVRVVADLFHIRNEGESFEVLRSHGDRIGHVHLSDPDRRPPGSVDEVWREFLVAVHDGGYRGSVSLECRWSGDPAVAESEIRSALDRVREARAALAR
ncbi:sugar phosphate isomerase/epimerase [Curtobacterium sp. PhB115]|uniref:sugar phosphate isomerase/epimerase family protein n=1 Tax=Curtobacterium sp. PhB115 TaxID=2485173 RepID=UPI000F4BAC18|nr:sugar phosphate isomerase/epimerase family protein [Curtobacterium sp. PhB115]ROP74488.1 sugar phosphate isomerase/epimerase [Curtobacterium sp. PhB115]